jgi:hypothetical protein
MPSRDEKMATQLGRAIVLSNPLIQILITSRNAPQTLSEITFIQIFRNPRHIHAEIKFTNTLTQAK